VIERKGERTRKTIVDTAAKLLRKQGYAATGLNQIVDESGAPKGSLYFHFPGGKDDLVAEALVHAADAWRAQLFGAIANEPDLAKSLRIVGDILAKELDSSGFTHGCPLATVTLETAATSSALHAVVSERYRSLEDNIAARIEVAGIPAPQARALSLLFLSSLEGALVLARAHRDSSIVRIVSEQLALQVGSMRKMTKSRKSSAT
jgi:TetR/AcrR family transcriptional repressor of lmrAB and yxaGH operons